MADDTQNKQEESQENAPAEAKNTEQMIPKWRFDEVNEHYKALKKEIDAIKQSKTEAETKALEEQNRYKELYEKLKAETDPLRSASEQLQRYRESFDNSLKARIERIAEDKRGLVPNFEDPIQTMAWLDQAEGAGLFGAAKPQAPNLNAASGASTGARDSAASPSAGVQSVMDVARGFGYQVNPERIAGYAKNPIKASDIKET